VLRIDNRTPFASAFFPGLGVDDVETVSALVKCTYVVDRQGGLHIADPQVPVHHADQFHGDPDRSSVRVESDACPVKPGTDVVLDGKAYAPGGRATTVDVTVQVGPARKTVRVFGERRWVRALGDWTISSPPAAFETMDLRYERAFGGVDDLGPGPRAVDDRNPVGMGFVPAKSKRSEALDGLPLPHLEDPQALIRRLSDHPAPAGFGPIGRGWSPRRALAGTYDEAWARDRKPLLPRDFDPRFHNGAAPGLVTARLRGGEPVLIEGASPDGPLSFALPTVPARITVAIGAQEETLVPVLDTVILEPDHRRVVLSWRVTVPCPRRFLKLRFVRVT
jgi:hypothetical protein